jgi:hypothetical protein
MGKKSGEDIWHNSADFVLLLNKMPDFWEFFVTIR